MDQVWCYVLQDSGNAIWLFAYFGYWVEVIIVLASKSIRGSLMSAKKGNPKAPSELPLGVKGVPEGAKGVSEASSRANPPIAAKPSQKASGEYSVF